MLHWLSLAVLVAGLLSVGPAGVCAQDSTVVCLSSFGWMNNSRSQNPCVVAAYLLAVCVGQYTITPLPVGYYYTGPSADGADTCQCSTVTYSMMSACGLCQNSTIISWKSWSFNCTTIYSEIFPNGIPAGTAVPHWAYQNVTPDGTFDITLAQSLGDNPESTATAAQSTVSVVSTSTSPLPISTSPSISPTGSSSSNTNVGAIAGGVVGGVVGVALIAVVAVFFIMRKRRSRSPPSAHMTQHKVYDPSDPSTFPVSRPLPTTITRSATNGATSFVTYSSDIPSLRAGDLRGVALPTFGKSFDLVSSRTNSTPS